MAALETSSQFVDRISKEYGLYVLDGGRFLLAKLENTLNMHFTVKARILYMTGWSGAYQPQFFPWIVAGPGRTCVVHRWWRRKWVKDD